MPKEPQDFAEVDPEDAEFEHLARIASLLTESDFDRMQPPAEVWESIVSQVSLADPLLLRLPNSLQDYSLQNDLPLALAGHRSQSRRSPRGRNIFLAAAAAVLVLVAGAVGIRMADSSRVSTEQVASVDLDVLEGSATAQAKLLRTGNIERLIVTAKNMPAAPAGSHYELWLVDPQVSSPQSLGPMTGSTEVVIPATINTEIYPVVDISIQKNGALKHSGQSLLRGRLQ